MYDSYKLQIDDTTKPIVNGNVKQEKCKTDRFRWINKYIHTEVCKIVITGTY